MGMLMIEQILISPRTTLSCSTQLTNDKTTLISSILFAKFKTSQDALTEKYTPIQHE